MISAVATFFLLVLAGSMLEASGAVNLSTTNNKLVNTADIKGDIGSIQAVLRNRLAKIAAAAKQEKMLNSQIRQYQLQQKVRQEVSKKIKICYERFQKCSAELSAEFCANSSQSFSFYLWAKQLARDIMAGSDGMHCPDELLQKFLDGDQRQILKI